MRKHSTSLRCLVILFVLVSVLSASTLTGSLAEGQDLLNQYLRVLWEESYNVFTDAQTSGDFEYIIHSDGSVFITEYLGSAEEVRIPDAIEGRIVKGIAATGQKSLFSIELEKKVKSVTIPEGVIYIGESAFNGCIALQDVRLSSTLLALDMWAFGKCTALSRISLPPNLFAISMCAFEDCKITSFYVYANSHTEQWASDAKKRGSYAFAWSKQEDQPEDFEVVVVPANMEYQQFLELASQPNVAPITASVSENSIFEPDCDADGWIWPVPDNMTAYSPYNVNNHALRKIRAGDPHYGIDISKKANLDVVASRSGVVHSIGLGYKNGVYDPESNSLYVTLMHDINGEVYYSSYWHLQVNTICVEVGDYVERGTVIAKTGNTGLNKNRPINGTHLHFMIVKHDKWIWGNDNGDYYRNHTINVNPFNDEITWSNSLYNDESILAILKQEINGSPPITYQLGK